MFYNYNVFTAILGSIILFFAGRFLCKKIKSNFLRVLLALLFFITSLPALSFTVYYAHIINEPLWYIQFRSINNIELLAGVSGLFMGYFSKLAELKDDKLKGIIRPLLYLGLTLVLTIMPFIKPIITPAEKYNSIKNKWEQGICIQTIGSTCGPSSLATILKLYGINKTEKQVAKACFTSGTSTEVWYLIRYARNQGLKVKLYNNKNIRQIPFPSIIGTKVQGNIGHFITFLGMKNNKIIIGDSMYGKNELSMKQFKNIYKYTGLAINIRK